MLEYWEGGSIGMAKGSTANIPTFQHSSAPAHKRVSAENSGDHSGPHVSHKPRARIFCLRWGSVVQWPVG